MNDQSLSQNRKHFVVRKSSQISGVMSSIERWTDENYAPQALEFIWRNTTTSVQIVAHLNGIDPQYFHIDLLRGQVILLLAPPTEAGQPVLEYYREVPLPKHVRQNVVHVDFAGDFVSVSLERKPDSPVQRIKAGITRLSQDIALLSGRRGQIDIFNSLDT